MNGIEKYVRAAKAAGCPRDQIENFLRSGIVLHPKQLEFAAACRECDNEDGPEEVGFGGARGGGKSHGSFAICAADDCQRCPGLKVLFLRKVGKAGAESFDDLRQRILCMFNVNEDYRYNSTKGILTFENGSRFILGHFQNESDIDAYLGLEYDVIAIEEATTLSEAKRRAIISCCRSSKPNWRPRIYYTTNPGGVGHAWFKRLFIGPWRKGNQTKTRFIPSTFRDNPSLNKDYVKMLDQQVGWVKRAWKDGDWDIAAGQFFSTFQEAVHVIKPFEIPTSWRIIGCFDYGFTHNTAWHAIAIDGDGNKYVFAEHVERKKLPPHHAECIKARLKDHGFEIRDLNKHVAGVDIFAKKGDKDGQTIAEQYEECGIRFTPATVDRINGAGEVLKQLGDWEEGYEWDGRADSIREHHSAKVFIFDTCPRLIECLPSLVHDDHRPEDVDKVDCDEDGGGGDDAYDDFRYGLMACKAHIELQVF